PEWQLELREYLISALAGQCENLQSRAPYGPRPRQFRAPTEFQSGAFEDLREMSETRGVVHLPVRSLSAQDLERLLARVRETADHLQTQQASNGVQPLSSSPEPSKGLAVSLPHDDCL